MMVFILKYFHKHVACGVIKHFSSKYDGFVILLNGADFRSVIIVDLLGNGGADMDVFQVRDDRGPLKEQNSANKVLGMLHLGDSALFDPFVQLAITPIFAHFRMNHVLVDCGQFSGEQ
ncbi:hypothetical protein SDC9_203320 [bioreactor metagenome]|uniref:Uncharacterized protein n=1 Tax=bioreactor metagenome TaxID=1076179 RepID=A0A645IWR6_9ZZZZ